VEPVEYLRGIRRRWRVILAAVLVAVVVALFTSAAVPASEDDSQEFEASVLLLDARGAQFGTETRGAQGVSLDTIAIFATLDSVAERAAERLDSDRAPNVLAESIDASADTETGILTITATARTGARAERVANAFARSLTDYLGDQRRGDLNRQIKVLERQIDELPADTARGDSTTRASLLSQIANLKVQLAAPVGLPVLDNEEAVAVVTPGLTAPSSGGIRLAIGALLGLLGGIALALVLERFDRRITTWRIAEEMLPYPLLAEVPRTRRSRGLAVVDRPTSRGADAFRLLASSTLHALEQAHSVRSEGNGHGAIPGAPMLAITSAVRSEGKSMISANLAAALGELGKNVTVMTADLRSPTIHRYFDAPAAPGIVDAIFDWDGVPGFRRIRHSTKAPGVSVIPAGSSSERPAAVLADEDLEKLVGYARAECDILIVDTPAILLSGDAVPLIQHADGVLLVARIGRTSLDAAERVSETLARVGAPVIGFALNGARGVGAGWRSSPYQVVKHIPSVDAGPVVVGDAADPAHARQGR
jgi:Mrp family chromosome partitioning ATPase/capsular polysaccharide biosynthesis protein